MDFGLGFSDELLKTSLMVVWELMKPSWCPSPKVDLILCATQDLQRELNSDCNLPELNFIYNLMTTASRSTRENNVELLSAESLWTRISCMWRSRHLQNTCKTSKDICKTTQAIKETVQEYSDESKDGNGIDCRLPRKDRGESSDCTRILQNVCFFSVTIVARTKA